MESWTHPESKGTHCCRGCRAERRRQASGRASWEPSGTPSAMLSVLSLEGYWLIEDRDRDIRGSQTRQGSGEYRNFYVSSCSSVTFGYVLFYGQGQWKGCVSVEGTELGHRHPTEHISSQDWCLQKGIPIIGWVYWNANSCKLDLFLQVENLSCILPGEVIGSCLLTLSPARESDWLLSFNFVSF